MPVSYLIQCIIFSDRTFIGLSMAIESSRKTSKDSYIVVRVLSVLIILLICTKFFVIVEAGDRGVLMKFGQVQDSILNEGLHFVIPLRDTVEKLSVRVQSQEISAEASTKDLQDIYSDVALNWHILPAETNLIFQQIGNQQAIVEKIISPAVEEVLKAVMARYTAEEIITRRGEVKASVDESLSDRLSIYHIGVDDISLVHVRFSDRFRSAVEAKQIAEQEAKRAGFVAQKALNEAEAKVNLARGEAEGQRLLKESLTVELLQRQAIERWNGQLPLIMGGENGKLFELELEELMKYSQR